MDCKLIFVILLSVFHQRSHGNVLSEPASNDYEGHQVIRLVPSTKNQLELLAKLDDSGDVDFWSHSFKINRSVDIHLTKKNKDEIGNALQKAGISFKTTIDNLDSAIDDCTKDPTGQQRKDTSEFSYSQFNTYDQILTEIQSLEEKFKGLAKPFSLGKTFEKNQIPAVKISLNNKKRKLIVIDCGTHAREWISPSTCLYIIRELLYRKDEDDETNKLLHKFNWVFAPVINPDGYKYTFQNKVTRLWRKNRSYDDNQMKLMKQKGKDICIGVDINRNFGFHWGGKGATSNPCSVIYQGTKAFSEHESKSLADFVLDHKDRIAAHLSLHSFSQVWMPPWGFQKDKPEDFKEQMRVAEIAIKAVKKSRGTDYKTGNSYDLMYPNSGSSTDWAYGDANIKYAYTVEMVDKGLKNFLQPPTEIEPNGQEIFDGIKAMAFALKTDDL